MATELNDASRDFDRNEKVNVIVINTKGKNFCTGIDVNYIGDKSIHLKKSTPSVRYCTQ